MNDSNGYYQDAFGEVFLVMMGILLALQVDSWNEQHKEKKQIRSAAKKILEYTGENSAWKPTMDFDSLLAIPLF